MPFKNQPPLYHVWRSMRDRCLNPNNRQWADYGGRGIAICAEWDSYAQFAADMGDRPLGHSLDRIDNGLGYSPENCRWADRKQQQRNQRRAVFVEIEGKTYRAIELAERIGVKTDTIVARAKRGLPYDQVMSTEKLANLSGLALGGKASGAQKRRKTHCAHGHEFTPENTIITRDNARACKTCHRERERKRRARSKDSEG